MESQNKIDESEKQICSSSIDFQAKQKVVYQKIGNKGERKIEVLESNSYDIHTYPIAAISELNEDFECIYEKEVWVIDQLCEEGFRCKQPDFCVILIDQEGLSIPIIGEVAFHNQKFYQLLYECFLYLSVSQISIGLKIDSNEDFSAELFVMESKKEDLRPIFINPFNENAIKQRVCRHMRYPKIKLECPERTRIEELLDNIESGYRSNSIENVNIFFRKSIKKKDLESPLKFKLPARRIDPKSEIHELWVEIPVKKLKNIYRFWKEFKQIKRLEEQFKRTMETEFSFQE